MPLPSISVQCKIFSLQMNEVVKFVITKENGVTEEMLSKTLPKNEIVNILNDLLQQNKMEVQRIGNGFVYKAKQNKSSSCEAKILDLIAQSGKSGLWLKDTKARQIFHTILF